MDQEDERIIATLRARKAELDIAIKVLERLESRIKHRLAVKSKKTRKTSKVRAAWHSH
jgi:hypothetical protein